MQQQQLRVSQQRLDRMESQRRVGLAGGVVGSCAAVDIPRDRYPLTLVMTATEAPSREVPPSHAPLFYISVC